MNRTLRIIATLTIALAATHASGQSFNIDYGSEAGVPSPTFAAAGRPGVWNVPSSLHSTPSNLLGLDGTPLGVTVTHSFSLLQTFDDPGTIGGNEKLLDDGLYGMGDTLTSVTLDGLTNGQYEVIVYGWMPTTPDDSTIVFVESALQGEVLGGTWPGTLQYDLTHTVQEEEVIDGSLQIDFGGEPGAAGFLNGIQVRQIIQGDIDGDGAIDGTDLGLLLGSWGPCQNTCSADLNDDGAVDGADLGMLLGNWG